MEVKFFFQTFLRRSFFYFAIYLTSLLFFYSLLSLAHWQPVSTDAVNIGVAIEQLKRTGDFQPFWMANQGYEPGVLNGALYPSLQRLSLLLSPSSLDGPSSVIFSSWLIVSLLPVLMVFFIRQVTKDRWITVGGIFFTLSSTSVARSLFLTPQSLMGYVAILVGCIFLVRFFHRPTLYNILGIFAAGVAAFTFHELSGFVYFMVALLAFTIVLWQKVHWKAFIFPVVGIFLIAIIIGGNGNPFEIFAQHLFSKTAWIGKASLYYPPWQLPVVFGFSPVLFALIGLFPLHKERSPRSLLLLGLCFAVPLFLLSQSVFLGFHHQLPDRFVAYLWIPLTFCAAFGVREIREILFSSVHDRVLQWSLLGLFIFVSIAPIFTHARSDIEGFGAAVKIESSHLEAFQWVQQNVPPQKTILTTTYGDNEKILYLPLYFNGRVTRYTLSDFEHSPRYEVPTISLLGKTLAYFFPKALNDHLAVLKVNGEKMDAIFQMIVKPDEETSHTLMDRYGISYAWFLRGSTEESFYKKSSSFEKVYENQKIVIYARK